MAQTKHTPKQDREYVEYVRPIQHKVSQRLVSIIDRLEAENAKMQALLERAIEDLLLLASYEFRADSDTIESAMALAREIETFLKEAKEVKDGN